MVMQAVQIGADLPKMPLLRNFAADRFCGQSAHVRERRMAAFRQRQAPATCANDTRQG